MKKRNYTLTALLALLVVGSIQAQDTTKIIEKEKTIISTSTPVQAEAEVKDNKKDNSSLKRFEFGGRYLPVISSVDIRQYNGEVIEGTLIFSQGAGVNLGFNVSPNVGIEANVNYYAFNQKYKDEGISREVSINYVDIPVLLSLNTSREKPVNLNLVAGPQFGLNFGSKVSGSGNENADTLKGVIALKQGDVGIAYGAGLEFALDKAHTVRLDLGYRGFYGLVDADGYKSNADTYNVIVTAKRKTNGAYIGFTVLF